MGSYTGLGFEDSDLNRFGTRFAEHVWDRGLRSRAAAGVAVTSGREAWWRPFAAARSGPGGGTQCILHLIRPPKGKTVLA